MACGNITGRRLVIQVSQSENRAALDVSERFAKRSESGAKLCREKLGLFPGGEVPALVDLVEINQVAIGAAGPCLGRSIDVPRKYRYRDRERNLAGLLCSRDNDAPSSTVLPI